MASEGCSTPALAESSTHAPEGRSTPAPAGSTTFASAESSTLAPAESFIPAPEGSSTLAPASSSTPATPGSSTSAPKDSFTAVSSSPEWNEGLKWYGSCLKLHDLLQTRPNLIHELGPDGNTVLHKGVGHGCVKLVKFVLVDMFNQAGICKCKAEANELCTLTREGLLRKTTEYGSTAVNMAIVSGSPKMVLLLEWAIRVSDPRKKKKVNTVKRTSYPVDTEQYGELLKTCGCSNERSEVVEAVVNEVDEVPDVKDDEISERIYLQEEWMGEKIYDRDMQLKLYEIIAAKLNEWSTGEDGVVLNFLKDRCAKDVDFEFVPVEHIFLHFLIQFGKEMLEEGHPKEVEDRILEVMRRFIQDIVVECKMWDEKNERVGRMEMTLFSILDSRGETIMHTLFYITIYPTNLRHFMHMNSIFDTFRDVASGSGKTCQCYIAKDGAGRTLYHMMGIYDIKPSLIMGTFSKDDELKPVQYPHVKIEVTPLCLKEFRALQVWSFTESSVGAMEEHSQMPIYLAVLFDAETVTSTLLHVHAKEGFIWNNHPTPFRMASGLGRTKLVEQFLKHQMHLKNIEDGGFVRYDDYHPAIHCAAASGQVEVVQTILKYPTYDPICQDRWYARTALHAVVGMHSYYPKLEDLKVFALHHVLPNSPCFERIEGSFLKHDSIKNSPRDFTKDEKICINLLLQAGIDMWTPNKHGEFPNVGSNANNEARSWWYDKVVKEVELKKASITSAANATSVVGALVATTSFIGPLQPPLSYSPEGYVNANPISIRIYLVCNSISFFFSIASILMAVLPSIPMPKESLYEEMIRSERCLKAAITLLLISIICILVSFSSASLAVVSSQWQDRKLIVASMIIGGGVCVVVLVIFIIRLIRMVFHKTSWLRRKFAKHMYF